MSKELSDKEFIAQCDSILGMIDDQGLDHYITCHDSPDRYEYTDPSLFKMWHDYMSLHDKIHNHLATAGDCRRLPATAGDCRRLPATAGDCRRKKIEVRRTMSEDKQRTHGQRLSDINRDIVELENLIGLLSLDDRATDDKKIRSMVRMHRKGKSMRAGFKAEAIDNLDNLKALRKMMLAENGPPKEIKCPHCGYDGELDKDHPDNGGFRILQPVLEPRLVLGWDGSKMSISDPVDSYDAFHGIAEPGHVDCLDSEDVTEGIREMRAALKGKWLFLCGRDECLGYFDASEWVERAHLEYGEVHGNQSAWTQ